MSAVEHLMMKVSLINDQFTLTIIVCHGFTASLLQVQSRLAT